MAPLAGGESSPKKIYPKHAWRVGPYRASAELHGFMGLFAMAEYGTSTSKILVAQPRPSPEHKYSRVLGAQHICIPTCYMLRVFEKDTMLMDRESSVSTATFTGKTPQVCRDRSPNGMSDL